MRTTRSRARADVSGWQSQRTPRVGVLVAAGAALALLAVNALREEAPGTSSPSATLPPWGELSPTHANASGLGDIPDAGRGDDAAAAADNASATDGAPPIAPEVAPVWTVSASNIPSLAAEHMPEAPTQSRPVAGSQDVAALRYRIETLLASDPDALRQAHALLDESDPQIRARNLDVLADSFGLD